MDGVCVLPLYARVDDESLTANFPAETADVGLVSFRITKGIIF